MSGSLDNWADWLDVNSARIKSADADTWSPEADVVLHALRVQGWVWRSVLIADPEVAVQPSMGGLGAGGIVHRPRGPDDGRRHRAPVLAASW